MKVNNFQNSSNRIGYFITFEGIDGSGKTTQIIKIANWMKQFYPKKRIILTKEPCGTKLGKDLMRIILKQKIHPETEALIMFAARKEHLSTIIEPALANGDIVLSDRFTDTTFAYQGGGKGMSLEKLEILEKLVQLRSKNKESYLIQPDTTFLFDLSSNLAKSRRSNIIPDKFEMLDIKFFERVRAEYKQRASSNPRRFILIDAKQDMDQIEKTLKRHILSCIK